MRPSTLSSTYPSVWGAVKGAVVGFLVFVALWWVASWFSPTYILPSPFVVIADFRRHAGPAFWPHFGATLARVGLGFAGALVVGTAAGIVGARKQVAQHLNALMMALQVVPGTILGIVFLLVFGVGSATPIALVVLLTLPTVTVNTTNALAKREVRLEQYLDSTGAGFVDQIRYLYFPMLVPVFQSNFSIGFGLALKVAILGEFLGSQDGLGYLLNVAKVYFRMDAVFFYLLVVMAVAVCFQLLQGTFFALCLRKFFYPA